MIYKYIFLQTVGPPIPVIVGRALIPNETLNEKEPR